MANGQKCENYPDTKKFTFQSYVVKPVFLNYSTWKNTMIVLNKSNMLTDGKGLYVSHAALLVLK